MVADDPIDIQPTISRELYALTDATLEAALAIARHEVQGSSMVRFAIIGMGKLGAGELNYVSDVDLIYVVEPALIYVVEPAQDDVGNTVLTRVGTKMATMMQRVCQSVIAGVAEPALWQIDGALRPEGKDGPLVRRLESHRAYYEQWAQNWEFQALLKARAVAGDVALGQEYMDMASSFVWTAASRENFVNDCQRMRERVENLIPANLKDREIKLGRGGLRDVEFTVQMLQLVHGRTDPALRTRSTLNALQALSEGGYVSRVQARQLSWDYRFERVLEHRQQMWQLKRTHLFPVTRPSTAVELGLPVRTRARTPPADVAAQTHPPVPRPGRRQRRGTREETHPQREETHPQHRRTQPEPRTAPAGARRAHAPRGARRTLR